MCFSASASFITAGVLTLTALVSFRKVKHREQIMLASIPLLFAVQQFSEGLVWLLSGYEGNALVQRGAAYIFLTFALIIWPLWISPSLYLIEIERIRKKILEVFFAIGCIWSVALACYLYSADIVSQVHGSNICYTISTFDLTSKNMVYFLLIYLIPVILPFFISSKKNMWVFGVAGLVSCFISYYLWYKCFLSVWCFFAAVLSVLLIVFFPDEQSKAQ